VALRHACGRELGAAAGGGVSSVARGGRSLSVDSSTLSSCCVSVAVFAGMRMATRSKASATWRAASRPSAVSTISVDRRSLELGPRPGELASFEAIEHAGERRGSLPGGVAELAHDRLLGVRQACEHVDLWC
jgi:hypothetical protein